MDDDHVWNNLIIWLRSKGMDEDPLVRSKHVPGAGRGLFTVRNIPPNTPLFTVPESAHMNIITLAPLYRSIGVVMTAIQIISVHIFLHRPNFEEGQSSPDPTFGPYISILPREFQGHPLSWCIGPQENAGDCDFLLASLPPGVKVTLDAMKTRFFEDWNTVSRLLNENSHIAASTRRSDILLSPFIPENHILAYLWAWLNGTRVSASPSDPNNITLCPLLDLANHTSVSTYGPPIGTIPTFFSPPHHGLKEGQEIYLRYGSHANATLFTEYGFIEAHPESGGQADVQDIVERHFRKEGRLGEWMKKTLTEANYWGDWKLYEKPAPAHPSYRLLPALRLLHVSFPLSSSVDMTSDDVFADAPELKAWRETLLGNADVVSPENEKLVWETIEDICEESAYRADEQCRALEKRIRVKESTGWKNHATNTILNLWIEERRVSQAVRQTIAEGYIIG